MTTTTWGTISICIDCRGEIANGESWRTTLVESLYDDERHNDERIVCMDRERLARASEYDRTHNRHTGADVVADVELLGTLCDRCGDDSDGDRYEASGSEVGWRC